jgi:hypothetical protein
MRVGAGADEGMERVLVLGSPGSGKSTFARQLAATLGLPVFHLDQIYWNPGWVETPPEQFREVQRALVRGERWIIDGDYGATLEVRLAAAGTVVVLDCRARSARGASPGGSSSTAAARARCGPTSRPAAPSDSTASLSGSCATSGVTRGTGARSGLG